MLDRLRDRWRRSRLEIAGTALIIASLSLFTLQVLQVFAPPINDALAGIATGALGGGVFTWFTKLLQISGVIREELEGVIYGEKHLKTRSDREQLWRNVTHALYGDRFPDLREKISADAMRNVLPSDRRFYVQNARRSVAIDLADPAGGVVEIRTLFTADLITDSGTRDVVRESEWSFKQSAIDPATLEAQVQAQRSSYQRVSDARSIDRFHPEIVDEPYAREDAGNGEVRVRYRARLKPSARYRVQVNSRETQILGKDNVIRFGAASYIDGLTVLLKTGPGLTTQFHPLGHARFVERPETNGDKCWENKDLLFSDAGYLASIQLNR